MSDLDLRLGECVGGMKTLPDKSVGVAISDPPYSEHTHAKVRRGGSTHAPDVTTGGPKRPVISTSTVLGFDHITQDEMEAVADEYARLVRRWVLVFTDNESVGRWIGALTSAGLEHVRVGAWVKIGCTPQFTGDRPASGHESIVIAHAVRAKGRMHWNGGGSHALWTVPIVQDRNGCEPRVHTTQKPLALVQALVRDFSDPGELVLDSHAGSGTTGVACAMLGRRFVGWERDPKVHAIALQRLASAGEQRVDVNREQIGLFSTPPPRKGAA